MGPRLVSLKPGPDIVVLKLWSYTVYFLSWPIFRKGWRGMISCLSCWSHNVVVLKTSSESLFFWRVYSNFGPCIAWCFLYGKRRCSIFCQYGRRMLKICFFLLLSKTLSETQITILSGTTCKCKLGWFRFGDECVMHISAFCMAVSTDLDMVASILKYFSNMSTYVQNALLQGHDSPVNLGFERLVRSMNFTIDNASIPSGQHTKKL